MRVAMCNELRANLQYFMAPLLLCDLYQISLVNHCNELMLSSLWLLLFMPADFHIIASNNNFWADFTALWYLYPSAVHAATVATQQNQNEVS